MQYVEYKEKKFQKPFHERKKNGCCYFKDGIIVTKEVPCFVIVTLSPNSIVAKTF